MFAQQWPTAVESNGTHEPLDDWCGDLRGREPHDRPASEERFEVFLGVGDEASGAIVATLDVDAALDLDERPALDVREVCAPFTLRVKAKLALKFGTAERSPAEGEFRFEARG